MSDAPTFDRDTTSGDRQYGPSGDTAMVAGEQLIIQRLARRAVTTPGSNPLHPTFGCGLRALAETVADDALLAEISGRVGDQFPRDPAVVSVDDIVVAAPDAAGRILVWVYVTVTPAYAQIIVPLSIGR